MKKKFSIDSILMLVGAVFLLFAIFPLIKRLFSNKNNISYGKEEEWVEVPLLKEKEQYDE